MDALTQIESLDAAIVGQCHHLVEDALNAAANEILELRSLLSCRTYFSERNSVLAFQLKFNVPMADAPAFLDAEAFEFRRKFMQEELDEFTKAHAEGDMHGAADALVDLTYVVHGTALMMGLPWDLLWAEVQRANMDKERATHAGQSKRGTALDVIKPPGWKGPDHTAALGVGPWPTFRRVEVRFVPSHDTEGGSTC